ncbi:hypothetical protein ACFRNJ_11960 [Streptomyces sp. NPDC056721]|uniref:hypothetical protein n=1 Tax=Streptomyces sp. NPDC056721 TaxID=3345923 RepID=UPI0036C02A2A
MAGASIVDNGSFDPRITSIPTVVYSGDYNQSLTRGWIIQESAVKGTRYRCNFLYNPSVVSVSHSINTNVLADQNAIDPNDVSQGTAILPLQQTVSFSLLFDRTYELWDSTKLSGDTRYDVATMGVGYDILSLYKITGIATTITVDGKADDTVTDTSFSKGSFTKGATGPMLWVPVYVVFGDFLDYYGVIQQLDVQYTHWTTSMVPSRCQVNVTMQLLPRNTCSTARPVPTPIVPDYQNPSILNPANNTGKAGR